MHFTFRTKPGRIAIFGSLVPGKVSLIYFDHRCAMCEICACLVNGDVNAMLLMVLPYIHDEIALCL